MRGAAMQQRSPSLPDITHRGYRLPGEFAVQHDPSIEITVITQSVAATNVQIGQTSLYEQSRKNAVPGGLMLCGQPTGGCDPAVPIVIAPQTSKRLWLRRRCGGRRAKVCRNGRHRVE
jgi:hypothetical protein